MKTFADLEFTPALSGIQITEWTYRREEYLRAKISHIHFRNGYGICVKLGTCFKSNGIDSYEILVLYYGNACYDSPIPYTNDTIGYASGEYITEIMKQVQLLPERPLKPTEDQSQVIELYRRYKHKFHYPLIELEKTLTLFLKDEITVSCKINLIKNLLWRDRNMTEYINSKTNTTMKSYKEEFNNWVMRYNTDVYKKLSDVTTNYHTELEAGQTVTFINDYFVVFPGRTIMGFCKPELTERCVYLDYDCYWFPSHPDNLFLNDGLLSNINLLKMNSLYILQIFRIKCVVQSHKKDEFVNLSPIQKGNETFEESLDNIRIDFKTNTISTDGKMSIKWKNFTSKLIPQEICALLNKELIPNKILYNEKETSI